MTRFFKKLPLSLKLFLLVLLPLALTIYLTFETYQEKSRRVKLLNGYLERIHVSVEISELIYALQIERRLSYTFAVTKDTTSLHTFRIQIKATDDAINKLAQRNDPLLKDFQNYTYLDTLGSTRAGVENGNISPDRVMHLYTTAIFRINSLNIILPVSTNAYLKPVFNDLLSQKLLSEMGTYLGIIRSNFFNALYHRNNNVGMLYGLIGVYDVYKSYEEEFLIKASPAIQEKYLSLRNHAELKTTVEYIDHVFSKFSFDTLYHADQWWDVSVKGVDNLRNLQQELMRDVVAKVNASYKKEQAGLTFTFIILIIAVAIVFAFMFYTTSVITQTLTSLNKAARKISKGEHIEEVDIISHDVIGELGKSISKINESQTELANAAESIGKGNFNTPVYARSEKDSLGNAIIHMREDLKQYTAEIEKSKEEFKQVADTAPVMIWMSDPDRLFNFVNKGWLEFTGRTLNQELGNGWTEGIHPEDLDRCLHVYTSSFDSRQNFYMEYRLLRHDGMYRWISDTGTPRFSSKGKFEGYIGSCIDIHESKLHEQRKDDFIKMASHELKTPVTSIKGYIQLLQNIHHDKKEMTISVNDVPMESSLTAIEKQVEKLTRLISELLDLSQIESGTIELQLLPFDLGTMVAETVQDFRHTTKRIITIQQDVSEKQDRMIYADMDRITQVLLNLLSNAVKYSHGKEIRVHIFSPSKNKIAVSVADEGIGIDKKDQPRIFERFYRATGKVEQTYPGFGIGLFVASEIIRWHNGRIEVSSEKNKGSVFTFVLPLATEKNFSDNGKDNIKQVSHSNSE